MELITNELRKRIPTLAEIEDEVDPIAVCKFYLPWSNWTWYVFAYDGRDTCFGYVEGFEPELGFFTVSELMSILGPEGMGVMRDDYFRPKRLSELKKAWEEYLSPNALKPFK